MDQTWSADMNINRIDRDAVTVLGLDLDRLDIAVAPEFKAALLELIEKGRRNLVVDLSTVSFIDSSGLGALVRALTNTQKEGGQTKLLNAGPQIRKLLQMTKLDSVFEIHEDMEAAVTSF